MKWHKQINNQDSHPDVQAVGFWGGVAFRCLCRISGEFDLDGHIPRKYAGTPFLIRRLSLRPEDLSRDSHDPGAVGNMIGAAVSGLIDVGLVVELTGGGLMIPGWKDIQGNTGADRQRSLRASRDSHKRVTDPSRDRPAQKRREEKRREEKETPSVSPSGPDDMSASAQQVIDGVNREHGMHWQKPHPFLLALLQDGTSVKDCLAVVRCKVREWGGTKRQKYVRQETLFAPKYWEGYVQQAFFENEDTPLTEDN